MQNMLKVTTVHTYVHTRGSQSPSILNLGKESCHGDLLEDKGVGGGFVEKSRWVGVLDISLMMEGNTLSNRSTPAGKLDLWFQKMCSGLPKIEDLLPRARKGGGRAAMSPNHLRDTKNGACPLPNEVCGWKASWCLSRWRESWKDKGAWVLLWVTGTLWM